MAELGFRTFDEMVGRSERIEMRRAVDHWKARNMDFSRILFKPTVPKHYGRTCRIPQAFSARSAPAARPGERSS